MGINDCPKCGVGGAPAETVEWVPCTGCSKKFSVSKGHLTEAGRAAFKCAICSSEKVLENRAEQRRIGNRQLLVEG